MNEYGRQAQKNWELLAPQATKEILNQDPNFFHNLGEQAHEKVVELSRQLAGQDLPEETFLEKLGRLNMSKLQAQEIVSHEMLMPTTQEVTNEQQTQPGETPQLHQEPETKMLGDRIQYWMPGQVGWSDDPDEGWQEALPLETPTTDSNQ
ncbi:TnpV protein [Rothia sp. ZJ932]|uniref:TnpV protein n=1 Tax=Rothia sp. ZJ932 TaxID=2810516 RepID=UPI0019686CDA|nr:TnpV protein [Rothia sp. ZJ932]QRZ61805.1 TnpV protein [Rothia sp. ZJ932]